MKYKKKFLIIGNQNAITYKEIFDLIKGNKIWLGYTHPVAFIVPDHYVNARGRSGCDEERNKFISSGNACWFTNLDIAKRHEELVLYKNYSRKEYPKYKNYDAIEVSQDSKDIPMDYDGAMGVPITFLDKHNPDQFEILGSSRTLARPMSEVAEKGTFTEGGPRFYLSNGDGAYRRMYDRLVIKNKRLMKIELKEITVKKANRRLSPTTPSRASSRTAASSTFARRISGSSSTRTSSAMR